MFKLITIHLFFFITVFVNAQTATDYFNRGNAKGSIEDYRGAIQDYNKAIVDSTDAVTYFVRGLAKGYINDYKGAIQDFNKAIEFNPKFKDAYHLRGSTKMLIGEKNDGCLDWSKAGELGDETAYDAIKEYCK